MTLPSVGTQCYLEECGIGKITHSKMLKDILVFNDFLHATFEDPMVSRGFGPTEP